ncbi:MAG: tRNA pseudouridine(55) synthase TruB [Sphaerochaeta sp.]|jgi:tRNA pseudouridine55 synthase|nr:tRNA pseudouridine(55) synthase TruB [Sphaerochaeta sp.]MCI2076575.1 tRNA pseudouridine(55) synthase TruB [Sphaerochaeta sp.]MCI2096476.1 tRNA pseudouridine(55) synthase TruB [Sphaerochaeta sp.]MCI2104772.1 tRNA pseudouridine(55) synthase TruB [Sphaerochaeta sp.]
MGSNASVLLVDKPSGVTSFVSLGAIKRSIDRKVGHTGTLDKFAQGLLVVLTGSMTRLNPLFLGLDKRYHAVIRFGSETDTLDPTGEVVKQADPPSLETINEMINKQFLGPILQAPPVYSAIHVAGQRASVLARQGVTVEMESRPVTIHEFKVTAYDGRDLDCELLVSKGTYIRSIARDLGHACGSCASLSFLQRTAVGPYRLDEAVSAEDTKGLGDMIGKRGELLLRLPQTEKFQIDSSDTKWMDNGTIPSHLFGGDATLSPKWGIVYDKDGMLRYVVDVRRRKIVCQIRGNE